MTKTMTATQKRIYKVYIDAKKKLGETSCLSPEYPFAYNRYDYARYAAMAAGIDEVAREFASRWTDTIVMAGIQKEDLEQICWELRSTGYDGLANDLENL